MPIKAVETRTRVHAEFAPSGCDCEVCKAKKVKVRAGIRRIQTIAAEERAWALKPFPPLIPEGQRRTDSALNEYLEFAVQAVKQGTKYNDFYQWAAQEGLNKEPRFFTKLLNAFKDARYDKIGR